MADMTKTKTMSLNDNKKITFKKNIIKLQQKLDIHTKRLNPVNKNKNIKLKTKKNCKM